MTNLEQLKKEVREDFRKEVARWPEMDALGAGSWWLDKIDHIQALTVEECIEITQELGHQQDDDTIWCDMDVLVSRLQAMITEPV